MSNRNVLVKNQLGENGAYVQDGAGTVTPTDNRTFNVFKIVTDTVFADLTSAMVTNVADLEGETLSAGTEWVIPGVTSFQVTSGIVIAYYEFTR